MSANNLEQIQNLLRRFQKKMMAKAITVRDQWNNVTCLKNLSQVQLARRMNVFGINATMSEVAQLFHYMGFKKNTMNFEDFMNLMETDPSSLGTTTRRTLSQPKDITEHETMHEYVNDVNRYCRNTETYTPIEQTRKSYSSGQTQNSFTSGQTQDSLTSGRTNRKSKKTARPFTASTSQISKNSDLASQTTRSRKQDDVIRTKKNLDNTDYYDEDLNTQQDDNHDHEYSSTMGNSTTFSYEPCRSCLERSLPRTVSSKSAREATLKSFSSSSIQRQEYDGTEPLKRLTRSTGVPLRTLVRKISEIAYAAHPTTWSCFLKWRDPHHDLLDANDLRNGLKYADNYIITQADAQKVIDRYGGPMNHSTFAVMIHDGSPFNTEKVFTDEDIYY